MAPTPDGKGYYLVTADGDIFPFGDAMFQGSIDGAHLNKPIVGIAVDNATGGYWLVAADGGIFTFNAPFKGSAGGIQLNQPVVGMAATPDGRATTSSPPTAGSSPTATRVPGIHRRHPPQQAGRRDGG